MIDLWKIDSAGLDPYQFRLMLHISRVGVCWKGVRTLSDDCGMSQGKVSTTRNWLEENGYIKKAIDLKTGKVGYSICEQWERSHNEQTQQNRSPHEQDRSPHEHQRSPHEHQRSPHEQDRSPHELKTITKDYNSKTLTEGIYIHPDPEPIAELKTALSQITKTPLWAKTEEEYDQAAHLLNDKAATYDKVSGFSLWWKANGYYSGKPTLSSLIGEWDNYEAGVTIEKNGGRSKNGHQPNENYAADLVKRALENINK